MTEVLFGSIVLAVVVLLIHGVLATRSRGHSDSSGAAVVAVVLAFWLAVPALLASGGLLDRYTPLPAPALLLIAVITVGTIVLALSSFGTRLAAGVPLAALVGYQAFRVAVELVLHRLYAEGVIPIQMTYEGRNFDILTGLLAAVLGWWLWRGRRADWLVMIWNVLGLALLINIVTIAVLSTPVPFRHFMNEPANLLPSRFPYVWLPTFLVQAALFGHLLVFKAIRRRPVLAKR